MGTLLGSALGPAEMATIHRSASSGGLYIRTKITLDLQLPLPDEVAAAHEDPAKGSFKAQVKFESLPQFCFLCGVVGHVNRFCPKKDELSGNPPRYGKHLVASEFGPWLNEATLSRRRKRFVWTLAGNNHGIRPSERRVPTNLLCAAPTQVASLPVGMTSHLSNLRISTTMQTEAPANPPRFFHHQDLDLGELREPTAKRACLGPQVTSDITNKDSRVEVAGPNRSPTDR
ncbi:unnamed protein product [Linum trigynum]|uniref:CCHC-type domain-containing protein n=1 Tax=Linum trigynum TaxID=586398 RepID=A0AAV2GHT2_9ROSI